MRARRLAARAGVQIRVFLSEIAHPQTLPAHGLVKYEQKTDRVFRDGFGLRCAKETLIKFIRSLSG